MKWGEIQIIALQKMFATDESILFENYDNLKNNDDCRIYFEGMIPTANEAIQLIRPHIQNAYEYDTTNKKYKRTTVEIIDDTYTKDTELELPYEACVLIPLYIASQLYKDDDISLATQYRNEFEAGLKELEINIEPPTQIEGVYYV